MSSSSESISSSESLSSSESDSSDSELESTESSSEAESSTSEEESDATSEEESDSTSSESTDSESSEGACTGDQEFVRVFPVRGRPRLRLPRDRRKMRILKIFDPPKSCRGARYASTAMMCRAKKAVLRELDRQRELGKVGKKPSPLEQAFLDASQESRLTFDYTRMKSLVQGATFLKGTSRNGFDADDYAYNDNTRITINGSMKLVERQLRIILIHECLHNTVERDGKPGNPTLGENIEHTAMALLGDREEQKDYFRGRLRVGDGRSTPLSQNLPKKKRKRA